MEKMNLPHQHGEGEQAERIQEQLDRIDYFQTVAEVFRQLYELAHRDPAFMRDAPHNAQISRPDEVRAARNPVLRWQAT